MLRIIFIGPQGSGKGTQAIEISKELVIPHISTGDLFRNAKGDLKDELETYMNEGKLVPDELTVKLLKERLILKDAKKGFILDGFPRNINQAKLLESITHIDKIIEITIPDNIAIERLSGRVTCEKCNKGYNLYTSPKPKNEKLCDYCGGKLIRRKDDNPEAIKKRLDIYHKETEPILKEYPSIKIDGTKSIIEIKKDILNNLKIA